MLGQAVCVWNVTWNLAHAIQIVRETNHLGWDIADLFERTTDHRCTGDFAKGTDVGQT